LPRAVCCTLLVLKRPLCHLRAISSQKGTIDTSTSRTAYTESHNLSFLGIIRPSNSTPAMSCRYLRPAAPQDWPGRKYLHDKHTATGSFPVIDIFPAKQIYISISTDLHKCPWHLRSIFRLFVIGVPEPLAQWRDIYDYIMTSRSWQRTSKCRDSDHRLPMFVHEQWTRARSAVR
jgi:hypothetical protein